VINPGLLEVLVKTAFRRLDGTAALVGEPLLKKRFPYFLQRLMDESDPRIASVGQIVQNIGIENKQG
jgi:hypothetical protein